MRQKYVNVSVDVSIDVNVIVVNAFVMLQE